jgi:alcohol dehydrogenase class IV
MEFEFATVTRIIFGPGSVEKAPSIAGQIGDRALLVIGSDAERTKSLRQRLLKRGIRVTSFQVMGEPTLDLVIEGVARARKAGCEIVVAMGGGSVLDTGKAIAALLTNRGNLLDYLEVVGGGQQLARPSAPCIAIPTTSGTGAEVTRNAVLGVPEKRVKVSMRSHFMLPSVAVVDPTLTYSMPPSITASTGLDALTQLLEAFVCNRPNPLTDGICREGLMRAARSLYRAFVDGRDAAAREEMAVASLFGGLALANAKLGAVHGIAGPLCGMFPAPHGVICGRFLPWVLEANIRALQQREPASPILARYDEVARMLTGDAEALAEDGIKWVKRLCEELRLPSLREFGLDQTDFSLVVANSRRASSMQGNPIALTDEELMRILQKAF